MANPYSNSHLNLANKFFSLSLHQWDEGMFLTYFKHSKDVQDMYGKIVEEVLKAYKQFCIKPFNTKPLTQASVFPNDVTEHLYEYFANHELDLQSAVLYLALPDAEATHISIRLSGAPAKKVAQEYLMSLDPAAVMPHLRDFQKILSAVNKDLVGEERCQ